uniref:hypothetical protein n=1 Tax=Aquipuribacter hungaricus TaxID=545624 RepID=UPI0030EB6FEA
ETARLPQPTGPAPERRPRNAAEVRSMLSGFQSGVTRGRAGGDGDTDGHHAGDAPGTDPGAEHGGTRPAAPAPRVPAQADGTHRPLTRTTDSRTTD